MFALHGQVFDTAVPQVIGDVQYPAGWFDDPDQREAVGIVDVYLTAQPACTALQKVVLDGFLQDGQDRTVPNWIVVDKTDEEIAIEAAQLAARVSSFIRDVDRDVDLLTYEVIGNRGDEYRGALTDAEAYRDAGYAGPVPESVQDYADAVSKSPQWAAASVLGTAAGWIGAQRRIRRTRLAVKETARISGVAGNAQDLDLAIQEWNLFKQEIRADLGLASN